MSETVRVRKSLDELVALYKAETGVGKPKRPRVKNQQRVEEIRDRKELRNAKEQRGQRAKQRKKLRKITQQCQPYLTVNEACHAEGLPPLEEKVVCHPSYRQAWDPFDAAARQTSKPVDDEPRLPMLYVNRIVQRTFMGAMIGSEGAMLMIVDGVMPWFALALIVPCVVFTYYKMVDTEKEIFELENAS